MDVDGELTGLAVDRLQGIERPSWRDPTEPGDSGDVLRSSRLVRVAGSARLLPDLDLHRLVGTLAPVRAGDG